MVMFYIPITMLAQVEKFSAKILARRHVERFETIDGFGNYSIGDQGTVVNDNTGRVLKPQRNQRHHVMVNLQRDGHNYMRSVSKLVAIAFVPVPDLETFDTVMHLDHNKDNNRWQNLTWRPRWFVLEYNRENRRPSIRVPLIEIETGKVFNNSWDASSAYGLLERNLVNAVLDHERVWPTGQLFAIL